MQETFEIRAFHRAPRRQHTRRQCSSTSTNYTSSRTIPVTFWSGGQRGRIWIFLGAAAGHVAPGESTIVQCTRGWTGDGAFSSVNRPTFERCRVALALHAKPSVIASITGDLADRSTRLYESVRLRLITRHVPFKPATSLLSWILASCLVVSSSSNSFVQQMNRRKKKNASPMNSLFVLWRAQHVELFYYHWFSWNAMIF